MTPPAVPLMPKMNPSASPLIERFGARESELRCIADMPPPTFACWRWHCCRSEPGSAIPGSLGYVGRVLVARRLTLQVVFQYVVLRPESESLRLEDFEHPAVGLRESLFPQKGHFAPARYFVPSSLLGAKDSTEDRPDTRDYLCYDVNVQAQPGQQSGEEPDKKLLHGVSFLKPPRGRPTMGNARAIPNGSRMKRASAPRKLGQAGRPRPQGGAVAPSEPGSAAPAFCRWWIREAKALLAGVGATLRFVREVRFAGACNASPTLSGSRCGHAVRRRRCSSAFDTASGTFTACSAWRKFSTASASALSADANSARRSARRSRATKTFSSA